MDAKLAKKLFKQADYLYCGKNYAAALELLDSLNAAYPNTRRILYPRAMCLAEVGRSDEGIAICERLISRDKFKRAKELKSRIQQRALVKPVWNAGVTPGSTLSALERVQIGQGPSAFAVAPLPDIPAWRTQGARLVAAVILVLVTAVGVGGYYVYAQ